MLKAWTSKVWAKLVKKYRLVLYDHESLSQSRHVIFKPLSMFALGAGAFILLSGLTTFVIFKVPAIHKHIPGYQSHLSEDYISLQRKNNELEREVTEMDSMLKVFSSVMGGEGNSSANAKMWDAIPQQPPSQPEEMPMDMGVAQASNASSPAAAAVPSNQLAISPAAHQPKVMNLIPPIDGYVTKDFESMEKPHFGIDLAAEENSFVRSVADGVVIFSEYSNTTGYVIGVWHSQYNLLSFYKHNSRLFKMVGSYVFAGEAIAVIGNTGINSTGTHLHFELWYDNNPVNPAEYIRFN